MSEIELKFVSKDKEEKFLIDTSINESNFWYPIVIPKGANVVNVRIPKLNDQEIEELKKLRELKEKHEKLFEFLEENFLEEFEIDSWDGE